MIPAANIPAQTNEPPADRAMRMMARAMDELDRGHIRDAADWLEQANKAVQVMLAFADARRART